MGRKRKARPATPEADDDDLMELDSEGKPIQRNAANARERARMRVLSKAFGRLKTTLPWVPADTKLSKLDTLRLASCYIAHLRNVLAEDEASGKQGEEENKKAKRPAESSKTRKTGDSPIHPITLVSTTEEW